MKKIILLFCLVFSLSIPSQAHAFEFEIAGGTWYQKPSGDLSFKNDFAEAGLEF